MTDAEREQTGLSKLTAAELAALNQWLSRRQQASAAPSAPSAPPLAESTPSAPAPTPTSGPTPGPTPAAAPMPAPAAAPGPGFETRIERREFSATLVQVQQLGSGKQLFTLDNGQIWRQTDSSSFRVKGDRVPVTLRPKSLGSWALYVESRNRGVRVKRVK